MFSSYVSLPYICELFDQEPEFDKHKLNPDKNIGNHFTWYD